MRSTIIIATFALAVIAAPIPDANPIFKGNGEGCVRRIGSKCSIRTRDNSGDLVDTDVEASFAKPDTQVEQRSPAMSRNKNSRSTEEDEQDDLLEYPEHIEQRSPYIRSKSVNQRDIVQDDADDLSDYIVQVEQRSPAMSRNKNSRNAEDEQEDVSDGSVQIKRRSPAMSRNKNSRSAEEDEVEDFSGQSTHIDQRSPGMSRNKNSRSAEDEEDEQAHNEARNIRGGGSNKRSAKPEPINRSMHSREPENTMS